MSFIRKLIYYSDIVFLLHILFFSIKIDFTSDDGLIPLSSPFFAKNRKDKEKVLRYVNLVLRLRKAFGSRDACLFTSILRCRFLRSCGVDAKVCFGVRKEDGLMEGHCWVEVDGVKEDAEFDRIFSYPLTDVNSTVG